MKPKAVVVATHGHCFDGMASAALYSHLMRKLDEPRPLELRYRSCGYGPKFAAIPDEWLTGDDNAILDFRFTPSRRVTWYFDHHVTGFADHGEHQQAVARGVRVFYEPTYTSCTKLIADVASKDYGVPVDDLRELIHWADVIDSARFDSAEAAARRDDPVLQLASVVEHHGDTAFLSDIVPRLLTRPLIEIASSADVQEKWKPLAAQQEAFVERVRQSSSQRGCVAFVDLSAAPIETGGKFVTYALYPKCVYSVMVSRNKQQLKVSVGYNPWCGIERRHDIAAICRRHGGGGHPAVGAFALPLSRLDAARAAAEDIVRELDG